MTLDLREKDVVEPVSAGSLTQSRDAEGLGLFSNVLWLWRFRDLIALMVRRDLLGRYRGSVMGAFWTIINPVGHLLIYIFLFCIVLKVRFGTDASTSNFALYLMSGLLPWGALSESLARATTAIAEQSNLVKRVVFPLEILPLVIVLSSLLSEVIALVILVGAAFLYQGTVHWTIAFLPLIMLSQTMFTGGLSWLFASLGVYIRDMRHMIILALQVWMYTTPIIYPASALPDNLQFLIWINPMAGIVGDYRLVILEGAPPDWSFYALYTIIATLLWFGGFYFFQKTKKSFADVM